MFEITNWESYANIVAGIATAIALFFVAYQTLKLREEHNSRLRAWVGLGEPHVFVHGHFDENDKFIPHKKWQKMVPDERATITIKHTRRYVEIKNFGQLPASNLKARTNVIVGKEPTRNDIESKPFSSQATIMPNGTLKLFIITTREQEKAIEDPEKDIFLIWEIEYESPKSKKRKYGEIMNISQQQYGTVNTWSEKD